MVTFWLLLLFLSGVGCGVPIGMWHVRKMRVQPPMVGVAVLMDGATEVSRRVLRHPVTEITKYHGREKNTTFRYTGTRPTGEMVFQVEP